MPKRNKKLYGNLDVLAGWLLVIGGLNWGLSLFDFNLVTYLAGYTFDMLTNVVYGAVGLSAVWTLARKFM